MRPSALLSLILFLPATASAQVASAPPRGVPLATIELLAGPAFSPDRLGDLRFRDNGGISARAGVTFRVAPAGALRPVVTLDYSGIGIGSESELECVADASCPRLFPEHHGWNLGVGLRAVTGEGRIVLGIGVGTAWYLRHATTVDLDGELRLDPRAGVMVSLRHAEVHQPGPGRVWFRTLTFGFRLQ